MKPPFKVQGSAVQGSTVRGSTVRGSTVRGSTVRGSTVQGSTVRPSSSSAPHAKPGPPKQTTLTARERETLCHLARGLIAKEIAPLLRVTTKTIEFRRASIYSKLKLVDQVQLAHYALYAGLIQNLFATDYEI